MIREEAGKRRLQRQLMGIKHEDIYAEGDLFYHMLPGFWSEVLKLIEIHGGMHTDHLEAAAGIIVGRLRVAERRKLIMEEAFDYYVYLLRGFNPGVAGFFVSDMLSGY